MNEINELWDRFISTGKEKDINKYKELHQKYNVEFWNKLLIEYTDNLKNHKTRTSIKVIDFFYNNYISYCNKEEKSSIQTKYNKFKKNKEAYDKKKILLLLIIVLVFLLVLLVLNLLRQNKKRYLLIPFLV